MIGICLILSLAPWPVARGQQPGANLYLPLVVKSRRTVTAPPGAPRINAPFFSGEILPAESAIFWFGAVTPTQNYADGRVGYNQEELFLQLTIFDRLLHFDSSPSADSLAEWDAATLYLQVDENRVFRFTGQLNWSGDRDGYQAAYRRANDRWEPANLAYVTVSGWRGNAPNDSQADKGWVLDFRIPFTSLGLPSAPEDGEMWMVALALHDRDSQAGPPLDDQSWPENSTPQDPGTWGTLHFGLPGYQPSSTRAEGTTTIRHGLNGVQVVDAHVGGHTTCGQPYAPDYFDGWGEANYAGMEQVNIQNQADVSDWPCFSKFYITFPLDSIPDGKTILSASLRLYQFGGSQPSQAYASLIQVLTVGEDWEEQAITWNQAPPALENVSREWVDPLLSFPGWPGVSTDWDLSRAVAQAKAAGIPLRLLFYSADTAMHSGKYFISSDTGDWNAAGRPTLTVTWGSP